MKCSFIILCFCLNMMCQFWPTKTVVLLRYPDEVAHFYIRLKSNFSGQDSFESYNRCQRKDICDLVLTANSYICHSDGSFLLTRNQLSTLNCTVHNYQVFAYNQKIAEDNHYILMYNEKLMTLPNSEPLKVRMFPCFMGKEMEIFLTYGFKKNYIFSVAKTPDNYHGNRAPLPLQIWNLIESSPTIFSAAENYFWDIAKLAGKHTDTNQSTLASSCFSAERGNVSELTLPDVPSSMEFGSLSAFQYFRICASIANELTDYSELQLDIGRQNIIYSIVEIHNQQRGILRNDGRLMARANVLPCAVNRLWANAQFYLLRDPERPASVFVLTPVEDETYGQLLKVLVRMDEVMALHDS